MNDQSVLRRSRQVCSKSLFVRRRTALRLLLRSQLWLNLGNLMIVMIGRCPDNCSETTPECTTMEKLKNYYLLNSH